MKSALSFSSALELYRKIEGYVIEVRCPRCRARVRGRRGSPLYCYNCGAVFDEEGRILIDDVMEGL